MPIRRRPNGSWLIDAVHDGKRLRKTVPADTPREQRRSMELALQSEVRKRRPAARATVRDALHRWWHEHGQHLAGGTVAGHLTLWQDQLGPDTPLDAVTTARVAEIAAGWTVAGGTANRRMATLRMVHNRARDVWEWPLARIAWRTIWKREAPLKDRSLDWETREALIAVWPERSRWLAAMAAVTGLRRGALLAMTREQLDFAAGVIRAVGKGRKENARPMHDGILAVLAAYGRLPDVGRLWPLTTNQLSVDLEVARQAIGRPDVGLHSLRHSFAQDLEDAGYGDMITAELDHSDPRLRLRYSHTRLRRRKSAVEAAIGTRGGTRGKSA